jgi:hypothetical protein
VPFVIEPALRGDAHAKFSTNAQCEVSGAADVSLAVEARSGLTLPDLGAIADTTCMAGVNMLKSTGKLLKVEKALANCAFSGVDLNAEQLDPSRFAEKFCARVHEKFSKRASLLPNMVRTTLYHPHSSASGPHMVCLTWFAPPVPPP